MLGNVAQKPVVYWDNLILSWTPKIYLDTIMVVKRSFVEHGLYWIEEQDWDTVRYGGEKVTNDDYATDISIITV